MPKANLRDAWVSYPRVSTAEQAERDLSLPAQRRAVNEYAACTGCSIVREYVEEGCSGTHMHRKAFRRMLEDIFRSGSDIGTIVVHHTSRFAHSRGGFVGAMRVRAGGAQRGPSMRLRKEMAPLLARPERNQWMSL